MNRTDLYSTDINGILFECIIDRNSLRASIKCVKDNLQLFQWPNITLKNFEQVHGLSRVLMLIPDKLATAIEINKEHLPDDTGDFLSQLVVKLLIFYSSEKFQRENPEISASILHLIDDFSHFETQLNNRREEEAKLSAYLILDEGDPMLSACRIYVNFLHPELAKIQRDPIRLSQSERFQLYIESLNDIQSLKSEFTGLTSEE